VREAAERARSGGGPTFVECLTYRRGGHKRDDPATYRPREEVEAWLERDPIPDFREQLQADRRFGEGPLVEIESGVDVLLDRAVEFALSSPDPAESLALEHVYAETAN